VATSTGVQGDFSSVVLPTITSGLAWDLVYGATSVALRVVLQGDYNRDNRVDAADYVVWRRTCNQTVPNGESADGNYDGVINALDYNIWRLNFGTSAGAATSSNLAQVPESIAFVTLAMWAISAAVGGRQKRWSTTDRFRR